MGWMARIGQGAMDFALRRLGKSLSLQLLPQAHPQEPLRLHIGGVEPRDGWKILNVNPGPHVDFLGDIADLSGFGTGTVGEVYASHVLEHVGQAALLEVLRSLCRILQPGGRLMISVPDLQTLCTLYLEPGSSLEQRVHVMRMMFGGQTDAHDFHYIGLDFDLLSVYLRQAGFADIQRVESFGLFDDTSNYVCYGRAISLNVVAIKG